MDNVLYKYRCHCRKDEKCSLETLYGVKPRFANEQSLAIISEATIYTARKFEIELTAIGQAERLVSRIVPESEVLFNIYGLVLLRRGNLSTGPKMKLHMWLGPYTIISLNHPHYKLKNAAERRSRNPIHVCQLRPYIKRGRVQSCPGSASY